MMNKLILVFALLFQTGIYNIHFNTSTGADMTLNAYAGKKILIVNIAGGSPYIGQLTQLKQLCNQYHNYVSVVVFPSNSFGHEPLNDADIARLCYGTYAVPFLVASKGAVAGSNPQPIYNWISNAIPNAVPVGDFHKFLIDKNGVLIGSFAPDVLPTDSLIIKAIISN